jgi:hypothetical protein
MILGPAVCQGCGIAVVWGRHRADRRWTEQATGRLHRCGRITEPIGHDGFSGTPGRHIRPGYRALDV